MNKLKETKILGFPLWMYLILSALMLLMAANDWMLTNMVGALAFAMIIGTLLGWVGDHIPVWKTWFGGGMLFACLVAGALNTFNLIGEGSKEALNTFNGSTGFLDLYILVLITGSVLSVDRKMLIKSFAGFIPTILAGIAGALALAGLATNAIGQLGDLSMSLIKREVGVKDYSHIFLTHGGMLDRFDSTLFITPWIYLLVCAGML